MMSNQHFSRKSPLMAMVDHKKCSHEVVITTMSHHKRLAIQSWEPPFGLTKNMQRSLVRMLLRGATGAALHEFGGLCLPACGAGASDVQGALTHGAAGAPTQVDSGPMVTQWGLILMNQSGVWTRTWPIRNFSESTESKFFCVLRHRRWMKMVDIPKPTLLVSNHRYHGRTSCDTPALSSFPHRRGLPFW